MTKEEKVQMISEVPAWFHKINFGEGVFSPGGHDGQLKLSSIDMPESLVGWKVLDVGAADGFFSFEAERRGADEVLATDFDMWTGLYDNAPSLKPRKAGFETARTILGSEVKDKTISVYDINPETVGCFDLVLFLGVFYHLLNPISAIENLFRVTKRLLIIETAVTDSDSDEMKMVLKPGFAGDPTNWWYPTPETLDNIIKISGFKNLRSIGPREGHARYVVHACKEGR